MASGDERHKNLEHNRFVLRSLSQGDLVEFKRGVYSHWGVYVGNEDIIHLAGEDNDGINANVQAQHVLTVSGHRFDKAKVCRANFWTIVGADPAYKNNTRDNKWSPFPPHQVVKNALEKVGKKGYSLLYENCEHFAKWCRYGKAKSDQVDTVVTGVAVGMAGALVLGLVSAFTKYWGNNNTEEEEEEEERRQEL
ncbi:phospholipase A and acyltransferase 2 [Aplysia californica]|uniref:Phospholipase A and acyltransferase 2 n=1 Tax=Aplysia californica TaxID=6500 RepID=A0ABM0J9Z4_APLCA|nr:phospholipase A and acyltransferase 2 [Aplysia californica]XP_005088862.1 phospholipase A and acyltransferase 2 [Aplysia californica]